MPRVTTFSRTFPGYHPRAGQPIHFVEKFLNRLGIDYRNRIYLRQLSWLNKDLPISHKEIETFFYSLRHDVLERKGHTIRAGHRWKAGQKFSPRIWSGKPYRSHQIIFAPDMELKKVWDITVKKRADGWWIDFGNYSCPGVVFPSYSMVHTLAKNDGLSTQDFLDWFQFPKPFRGQIICWDERINY